MFRKFGIERVLFNAEGSAAGGAPDAGNAQNVANAAAAVNGTQNTSVGSAELGKDGTPFDAARAQATIETLREKEKAGDAAIAKLARIEADKAKADEEALKSQGEFERIADDYKGKFESTSGELEAAKADRDKAFELLTVDIEKRVAALPEGVHKEVPSAKDATPLARLEKIAEIERYQAAFAPAKLSPTAPLRGAVAAGNHSQGNEQQPVRRSVGVV